MKAAPVCLSVNAIFDRRFIHAGQVLDAETLSAMPSMFRRYIIPVESESEEPEQVATNFQLNTSYRVGREDRLLQRHLEQQAVQQAAAAQFQDAIEAQLEHEIEHPAETIAAALADVEDQHNSDVQRQIAEASAAARQHEMADEAARQFLVEQDEMIVDDNHQSASPAENFEIAEPKPESEWSPKPKRMRKRYINRNGVWCRTKRIRHFKSGEPVYVRNGPNDFEKIGVVNRHGRLPAAPYLEN
jgi:hypothetical protein